MFINGLTVMKMRLCCAFFAETFPGCQQQAQSLTATWLTTPVWPQR